MKGEGCWKDRLKLRTLLANFDPTALRQAPAAPQNGVNDGISSEAKALQEVPQVLLPAAKLQFCAKLVPIPGEPPNLQELRRLAG